jgi:hypothetical protein
MLTIHGQHHPKADIDRLYVPRKDGGRGLVQIEGAYLTEVIKLKEYVEHTDDPLMQIVRKHQHNTTQAEHCTTQPPISRNLFRVTRSK